MLLGAVALALTACSGGPDDSGSTTPHGLADTGRASGSPTAPSPGDATPDSDPAAAYLAWLEALREHDAAAACRALAPELVIELRQQAILEHRAELGDPCTGFVAIVWEDPGRQYDPVAVETTYVTDERATVAATFEGSDETVDLVYDDAAWRVVHAETRAEEGTSSTTGADPARWLQAWCTLDPGMTRDAVVAAMGPPSGEYTVSDGGEPQLWWAQDQYDFRAYLDADGSVLELVGDYDSLSQADRELVRCPELRN
jgi:hypothetical protein